MRLIETYKDWVNELIGYTRMGDFEMTQTHQLVVLRNLTFDALDQLEFGKPLPEIFENFKHYPLGAELSFTYNKKAYPLFLYVDDNNCLTAVSTKFYISSPKDQSGQAYPGDDIFLSRDEE